MAYPVPAQYRVNQGFRSYATAGVVGRPDGSEIQYLVWLYGDYQPYGHAGADIACPIGTPVYAIADGIVVWADWGYNLPGDDSWGPNGYFKRWGMYKNFPGIVTVIWHPHLNKFSIYGHLSSNDLAPVGARVKDGQQIALSGNTKTRGETVGPHLHIAVVGDFTNYSTGGKYIFGCEDPVPYFTTGSLSYASESITPLEEDVANTQMELQEAVQTVLRDNPLVLGGRSVAAGVNQALLGIDVVNDNISQLKAFIAQRLEPAAGVKSESEGTFYFKGTDKPEVYALDAATGNVRHVQSAEFDIVQAINLYKEVDQAKVDALLGRGK